MTLPTDTDLREHRKLRDRHDPVVSQPQTHEDRAALILGHVRKYGELVERTALAARDGEVAKCSRLAHQAGEQLDVIAKLLEDAP